MSKNNKKSVNPTTETNVTETATKVNTPRITLHVAKRYESMHKDIAALAQKWDVEMSNLIWHLLITNTTFEQASKLTERPQELRPITEKKVGRLQKVLGKLTPEQLEKLKDYLAASETTTTEALAITENASETTTTEAIAS